MDKFLSQFRRLYDDRGANDKDFTVEEQKLREAKERLANATADLVRSSDRLNAVALGALVGHNSKH